MLELCMHIAYYRPVEKRAKRSDSGTGPTNLGSLISGHGCKLSLHTLRVVSLTTNGNPQMNFWLCP